MPRTTHPPDGRCVYWLGPDPGDNLGYCWAPALDDDVFCAWHLDCLEREVLDDMHVGAGA